MNKRKILRIFLKGLLVFAGIILVASVFLFDTVDRSHYKGTAYERQMKDTLSKIPAGIKKEGKLKAGWAKVNITPDFPIQIASYGLRANFEKVHDSVWARAFVFDNGLTKSALVTVDLLIFPPTVVNRLRKKLPEIGFSLENTFLSASHTHNAPGGWAEGIGGRVLAGEYSEEYVNKVTDAVVTAIKNAEAQTEDASMGFGKYAAEKFMYNRLTEDTSALDRWLRVIKVRKKSGSTALMVTYAAHPNIISSHIDHISGDYAGALVTSLEKDSSIDFAAFCAGAVAGHNCKIFDKNNFEHTDWLANELSKEIKTHIEQIELKDSIAIRSLNVPLYLQEPQLKIAQNWKARPWVFKFLFGKEGSFISALELGETVLVGTPCDFSGELVKEFSDISSDKKINIVITSFNGGYVGYIIPDKYYDLPKREARDMSWYGPYNGAYFTEIIRGILKKI